MRVRISPRTLCCDATIGTGPVLKTGDPRKRTGGSNPSRSVLQAWLNWQKHIPAKDGSGNRYARSRLAACAQHQTSRGMQRWRHRFVFAIRSLSSASSFSVTSHQATFNDWLWQAHGILVNGIGISMSGIPLIYRLHGRNFRARHLLQTLCLYIQSPIVQRTGGLPQHPCMRPAYRRE